MNETCMKHALNMPIVNACPYCVIKDLIYNATILINGLQDMIDVAIIAADVHNITSMDYEIKEAQNLISKIKEKNNG